MEYAQLPQEQKNALLVGPRMMDLEAPASGLSKKAIQDAKSTYSSFVNEVVEKLKGRPNPQNMQEFLSLWSEISSAMAKKFRFVEEEIILLVSGISNRRLDCDVSAFLVADIFKSLGITTKIAVFGSGHAMLQATMDGKQVFLETNIDFAKESRLGKTATHFFSKSDVEAAHGKICYISDFEPDASYVYANIASAYDEKGNANAAIRYNRKAIKMEPQNLIASVNLAGMLLNSGEPGNMEEGARMTLGVLKADPDNVVANRNYGTYCSLRGKNTDARLHFSKALNVLAAKKITQLQELAEAAFDYIGLGTVDLNEGNYPTSLEFFTKALNVIKQVPATEMKPILAAPKAAALENISFAYGKMQNFQMALSFAQESVRMASRDATAYTRLGEALAMMGQYAEAAPNFEKALELEPMGQHAYTNYKNLGNILQYLGKTMQAEECFRKARQLEQGKK